MAKQLPSIPENGLFRKAPFPFAKLSEDLQSILNKIDGQDISFAQILSATHGRGPLVLLILLGLFSMLIPGTSVVLGCVIAFWGLRIAVGGKPFLPEWLLKKTVKRTTCERILLKVLPLIKRSERYLCPRMIFFQRWRLFRLLNGLAIAASGLALALPLPPPTNTMPAIAVIILSAGMMEEDGFFILAGYLISLGTWLYLGALLWMGQIGWEYLKHFALI